MQLLIVFDEIKIFIFNKVKYVLLNKAHICAGWPPIMCTKSTRFVYSTCMFGAMKPCYVGRSIVVWKWIKNSLAGSMAFMPRQYRRSCQYFLANHSPHRDPTTNLFYNRTEMELITRSIVKISLYRFSSTNSFFFSSVCLFIFLKWLNG